MWFVASTISFLQGHTFFLLLEILFFPLTKYILVMFFLFILLPEREILEQEMFLEVYLCFNSVSTLLE